MRKTEAKTHKDAQVGPQFSLIYRLSKSFFFSREEMGRRKAKNKPPPKRKAIQPLDTQFNCPFCNHEKSCEVKM